MALVALAKKGNFFHIYDFRVKPGTGDRFIDLFNDFDYSDENPMHKSSAQVKDGVWTRRAVGLADVIGAAGRNDAFWSEFANRFVIHVERMQFAVHADFTHAAGDQLGVLGTEVEDQDAVGVNVEGHGVSLVYGIQKQLGAESNSPGYLTFCWKHQPTR